ncbi:hypothetical protein CEY16_01035 [Halalkalibacillus sediminis]|uniref:DZANK-type domain-containing protein n=1 Tax=Halalkalibacillus sediminis TaxID=2018042 RepID=A0A2I0QVJ6_9BACI|nr:zinc ribbon domain-containing protein [Halalkalibacillus sediminis]PKR78372.1 hypothetical protein CEY16_01035 [Halalkalibacillus sediminis]
MNEEHDSRISQLKHRKTLLLTKLGESIYHEYRLGNVYSDELKHFGDQLQTIDKQIYKTLEEQNSSVRREHIECDCGHLLDSDDYFCPKCGKKAPIKESKTEPSCDNCNTELYGRANFCHVCGSRQVNEKRYAR